MTDASEAQQDEVLGIVEKNSQEAIRILRRHYMGTDLCDLRIFVRSDGPDGQPTWLPTRKGVAIRLGLLPPVVAILRQFVEQEQVESEEDAEA